MTRRLRYSSVLARSVSAATLAAAMFLAIPARAEGWLFDGQLGAGSGLEGGDPGTGKYEWNRARVRIVAGLDMQNDEDESAALGFRAFAELEKRGSAGGEARYIRWLSRHFGVHAGVIGTVAPETLFGGGIGATLVVGNRSGLFIEPAFYALPLGSDLPDGSVLMWGLLTAGVRLAL